MFVPTNKIPHVLINLKTVGYAYGIACVATALQVYFLGAYKYNNYLIFKYSFIHLINNKDLYVHYPNEYFDLYKYSPTFALAMAPFAYLPDVLGLILWNALNGLPLFFAVRALPLPEKAKAIAAWLVLLELITSLQNTQSNGLLAAGLIGVYLALERNQSIKSAASLTGGIFIKIFSGAAGMFWLVYPNKMRFGLYILATSLVFAVLPIFIVGIDGYIFLLKSWRRLLAEDNVASAGLSVMGILRSWFGFSAENRVIQSLGAILLLPVFVFGGGLNSRFRLLLLADLTLWLVIFNHKAESPTFVIAAVGAALWFVTDKGNKNVRYILLFLLIIFTFLSPTDIFPAFIRRTYIVPYQLKAVPCVFIWIYLHAGLLCQIIRSKSKDFSFNLRQ